MIQNQMRCTSLEWQVILLETFTLERQSCTLLWEVQL